MVYIYIYVISQISKFTYMYFFSRTKLHRCIVVLPGGQVSSSGCMAGWWTEKEGLVEEICFSQIVMEGKNCGKLA